MAYLLQKSGKVFVDIKNGSIIRDTKTGKILVKQGLAEIKDANALLIYSKADLVACFAKHVQGKPNDNKDYHVLKRVDEVEIAEEEFRILYEAAIKTMAKIDQLSMTLPSNYFVQIYNKEKIKDATKRPAKIQFRDIPEVDNIPQFCKIAKSYLLAHKEIQEIITYWDSCNKPDAKEKVRYALVIGHSDIR